jgi:hypothetical protein
VFAADLDGDGDPDVLSASELDGEISWYENVNGASSFAPRPINTGNAAFARVVRAVDLDGDGDNDVLVASPGDDTITWYENHSNDCNNNGILDACEPDCNNSGEADACDLLGGTSIDCNGNGVPDECDAQCGGPCDTDGDGCVDDLDIDPFDPNHCGDSDRDTCDDCASGTFDPYADGSDQDGDAICDPGDCDAVDGTVWLDPGPAGTLTLHHQLATTTLAWLPPSSPGAVAVAYDLLRSPDGSDFFSPAVCLEADEADRWAQDNDAPASGDVFHYLVRGENDCPGGSGAMGAASGGTPRVGIACP